MGCDSQFVDRDDYRPEVQLERENARLKAEIARYGQQDAERTRDARGYDSKNGFFICRFDRTVTDSMDDHDRFCTGSAEKHSALTT